MEMPRLGETFALRPYGEGTVVFVGVDYFGFRLERGWNVLVRLDGADRFLASAPEGPKAGKIWPESTFVQEPKPPSTSWAPTGSPSSTTPRAC